MNTTIKIGSVVTVPPISGVAISSADMAIIGVSHSAAGTQLAGLKLGTTWLTASYGVDLQFRVQFTVVA